MNILVKLLPVILISIIFYILVYKIYPSYQETIELVKKLNELNNKEKELKLTEKLIQSLEQNANIQQLIANKETLNLWLPSEPKIEELIYSLNGIYKSLGYNFEGAEITIKEEKESFQKNILPIGVIDLKFSVNLSPQSLIEFINNIEKNVRLMKIKKAVLSPKGSSFDVESYYLPLK